MRGCGVYGISRLGFIAATCICLAMMFISWLWIHPFTPRRKLCGRGWHVTDSHDGGACQVHPADYMAR